MSSAFLLFDAARAKNSNLQKATEKNSYAISLYRGRSEEVLASVAPYIFPFPHSNEFSDFIFENGWGNSWGVIVYSSQSIEDIFVHFRKFLMVKTEGGKELYFRFYDPRVLKMFLPTCDKDQITDFFGPIEKFIVEGDTKESAVSFFHKDGLLKQEPVNVAGFFGTTVVDLPDQPTVVQVKQRRKIIDDDF